MVIDLPQVIQYSICRNQTYTSQNDVLRDLMSFKGSDDLSYTFQSFENKFNSLTSTWKQDTSFFSSINEITTNKAYLQIIAMGEKALPYIFKSMANEPHHWFVALSSITGINPIKHEHRGDISQMTSDWLEWAKKEQYYVA
jgi:hypothetical protein